MHIERLENVPYRFEKTFDGVTRQNGKTFEDEVVHFVRDFSLNFDNDRSRVGAAIEQDPTSRSASFGYGVHHITRARTVIAQGINLLARRPALIDQVRRGRTFNSWEGGCLRIGTSGFIMAATTNIRSPRSCPS